MINIENQNIGSSAPMNSGFENVLSTGLRELTDRNLPEVMRGETRQVKKMTTTEDLTPKPTGPRMNGIVKWFNPTKGFGFITPSNGGLDVFVHQSEIQLPGFRSLAQGEPVEYQLYDGQKGPKALKVTGPQGNQVKGAPRQTKAKPEKPVVVEQTQVQPNFIKIASNYFQVANQIPVSTPVLAPTQALNALPSMISTPTPGASPQISHFFVTQPGLQNYYTTTTPEIPAWTTAASDFPMTTMPMSPTPMMIEGMQVMSPQPQYIPITPQTPTPPYAFPKQTHTQMNIVNSPQMNLVNSPPAMDYGYHMSPYMQTENPYDQTPNSFHMDESSQMQITSPMMSPIHC